MSVVQVQNSVTNPLHVNPTGTTAQPVTDNGGSLTVDAVSLPLPTGAATETTLSTRVADATVTARLGTLGQKTGAGSAPVVLASDQTVIPVSDNGGSLTVDATSLPLPTGAATEATLATRVADATVTARLGTLGQKLMAGSTPVVIASDQVGPKTAFGEPVVAEFTPISQQHFTYGINPRLTKTLAKSGATVTGAGATGNGADAVISIDNTANEFAIARGFRALHYRAGIGQGARFTAAFNAGVANSQQLAGLWSPGSGYFVGFNGITWGCTARTGGVQEVRTLTVTTASTNAETIQVRVDGTNVAVPVTNQTGLPSRTAWEISQGDYSGAGAAGTWGWDAYAVGAVVYFVARRARVVSGAFNYTTGDNGFIAAWASVRTGVAETDSFSSPGTPGALWTWFDALDGTGPSGLNFDKTHGVIYGISAGHLGHRGASFFFFNPNTGNMSEFARYTYLNSSMSSAMNNPTLYMSWGIVANGSTTAMTMYAGSGMAYLEGKIDPGEGQTAAVTSAKDGTSGTIVHYTSIRNGAVAGFGGQLLRASRTELHIKSAILTVANAAGSSYVDFQIIRNPVLTNLANFAPINATRLAAWAWQDTTTTTATVSGGDIIDSPRVPSGQSLPLPLDLVLEPGETLSVTAKASAASMAIGVTISGKEIQ